VRSSFYENHLDPAPAIQELLVCAHGCVMLSQLAAQHLKTIAKLLVQTLIVVAHHV
jgi:hypothetical protein